jgi:hypothetical protein
MTLSDVTVLVGSIGFGVVIGWATAHVVGLSRRQRRFGSAAKLLASGLGSVPTAEYWAPSGGLEIAVIFGLILGAMGYAWFWRAIRRSSNR